MDLYEFEVQIDKAYTARVSMRAVSLFEKHWRDTRGERKSFLKTLAEWEADDVVKFLECCLGDQVKHLTPASIATALPFEYALELPTMLAVHCGKGAESLSKKLGIQAAT